MKATVEGVLWLNGMGLTETFNCQGSRRPVLLTKGVRLSSAGLKESHRWRWITTNSCEAWMYSQLQYCRTYCMFDRNLNLCFLFFLLYWHWISLHSQKPSPYEWKSTFWVLFSLQGSPDNNGLSLKAARGKMLVLSICEASLISQSYFK